MTAAEDRAYVAQLVAQAPPLTQEQALAAARILISLPVQEQAA